MPCKILLLLYWWCVIFTINLAKQKYISYASIWGPQLKTTGMACSCVPICNVHDVAFCYFFVPFLRPCMHLNYGAISGSHACRDCGWHIILVVELYTTCPGERVLVAIRFNVTFLPLRLCYVNTSTCFLKDAESLITYGYVLWCSQIVCIRRCSLNTMIAFYSVNEWSNFAVSVWSMAWQATMLLYFT